MNSNNGQNSNNTNKNNINHNESISSTNWTRASLASELRMISSSGTGTALVIYSGGFCVTPRTLLVRVRVE